MKNRLSITFLLLVAVVSLAGAACENKEGEKSGQTPQAVATTPASDQEAASQAVVEYYQALAAKDYQKACDRISANAQAQLQSAYQAAGDCRATMERYINSVSAAELEKAKTVKVTGVQIQGQNGTATVEGTSQSIPLVKDQGQWKIASFNIQTQTR